MEWLFALVATSLAVGYAVLLGRGIERRKRWALEMARAVGTLDCGCSERLLRDHRVPDTAAHEDAAGLAETRLAA